MQKISVSTLISYLKNKLDTDHNLQRVSVIGELSNYHRHYSGHLYFTLKDEHSQISCVMFKSNASTLSFEPKTGDKVEVIANTSIFETSGQLQLYVVKMSIYGLGDLYAKYEALKLSLSKDGYFDLNHKKQLDKTYLDRVAVLVGDKSAAMSDIKTQFQRRWPLCIVDYYPVLVQGKDAPSTIIEKLIEVDPLGYDAIILARGGGSFEDLFCFNDESLVKTIYNLKTFIVTGVGHEQDFTLVDFVSDLRAPTPTAAVELITPNKDDVGDLIQSLEVTLHDEMEYKINNINSIFDYHFEKLIHYQTSLKHIDLNLKANLEKMKMSIEKKITISNNQINNELTNALKELKFKKNNKELLLKRYQTLLEAYSTNNVLKRGYTLVIQDDKVVKKAKELKDTEFEIKFIDKTIKAMIKE